MCVCVHESLAKAVHAFLKHHDKILFMILKLLQKHYHVPESQQLGTSVI